MPEPDLSGHPPGDPAPGSPPAVAEPPGAPFAAEPSPHGSVTGSHTPPPVSRSRSAAWFGDGGAVRRFISRWGFSLFVVLVVILGREVLLPFVFAGLIAYILAPVVRWMADRRNGTRRMPRGLAIVICYLVFISLVAGFLFLLVPRLSRDIARLGTEAPALYKRINEQWTPEAARWLEARFPSLAGVKTTPEDGVATSEPPLPPRTAFTAIRLDDQRYAMQLAPGGVDIKAMPDGSYRVQPNESGIEPASLEAKLRAFAKHALIGLQSQLNDLLRLGQSLVVAFIRGIFLFFFTLMIGAFLLIDLEKVHAFLRNLFPTSVRDDYDVIIAGIDRGLSGVIRGQLLICLINSALTYVGLLIFGVKYGLILAIVAGLMSLVPIFGSILSSIPIVIVALASGAEGIDIFRGVAMTLWIVGIHFIEANLLNPKIIGTAARIHPVLVIFSLFLGEHTYGLVGALLAVPVLSAISVVFMFFYKKAWKDVPRTAGRGDTAQLAPASIRQPAPAPVPPPASEIADRP